MGQKFILILELITVIERTLRYVISFFLVQFSLYLIILSVNSVIPSGKSEERFTLDIFESPPKSECRRLKFGNGKSYSLV